jgi:mannose-6-phosphate isomerase-like protein (cupin superfamily)
VNTSRTALSSLIALRAGHRRPLIGVLALILIAVTVLGAGLRQAGAQDATPTAANTGVKVDVLGKMQSSVAPDRVLILQRRTFAPGSDSGAHPAQGPVVLYVDSGSVVFSVVEGAAIVTRAGSTTTETITAGNQATLATGDEVSYDEGVVHEVSNPADQPAVTYESRLNPSETATPTPTA